LRLGVENALSRALMVSLVAGAGSPAAIELHARQRWNLSQITPERFRASPYFKWGQENLKLESQLAINKIMAEGKAGEFFKMRVTGALTMIESLLFLAKAKELAGADGQEATRRAALEFGAASLTTTAAALEIGGLMQEWLATKTRSDATRAAAEIRLGGFKLAGNALAGVAGVVGAYYDFKDREKADKEQKYALAHAFYARSVTNGLAVGTGLALGYSYSGPLLEHWAAKTGSEVLGFLGKQALKLAANRAWLFAATWWITFVTIALSFVIAQMSDDAMQKWVKRSSFRGAGKPEVTPEPLYTKPGEELVELHNAFAGVSS
jgi:hypothetical protein